MDKVIEMTQEEIDDMVKALQSLSMAASACQTNSWYHESGVMVVNIDAFDALCEALEVARKLV